MNKDNFTHYAQYHPHDQDLLSENLRSLVSGEHSALPATTVSRCSQAATQKVQTERENTHTLVTTETWHEDARGALSTTNRSPGRHYRDHTVAYGETSFEAEHGIALHCLYESSLPTGVYATHGR